jgi:hypothetical protein
MKTLLNKLFTALKLIAMVPIAVGVAIFAGYIGFIVILLIAMQMTGGVMPEFLGFICIAIDFLLAIYAGYKFYTWQSRLIKGDVPQ